jgi:hypothetical protein
VSVTLHCRTERRRKDVREAQLSGLDYLEVSPDQTRLTVYFLGKAPEGIEKENVVVEGGRRPGVRVTKIEIRRADESYLDDSMRVLVDRPGDFSTYSLRVVEVDEQGRPTDRPLAGFDPRYDRLDFSFKVDCPTDLDCKVEEVCPPPERDEPTLDYLAKDYASFRRLVLDRLAVIAPDWQERHAADLGIALVELLAYVGDHLSYYQDAVATEAYIGTARRRISVRRHARLVDYVLHEGCNARAWVCVETDADVTLEASRLLFVTRFDDSEAPLLDEAALEEIAPSRYEPFEPIAERELELRAAHSTIRFYTWGDTSCCLAEGATSATLRDDWVPPPPPEGDGGQEGEGYGSGYGEPPRYDYGYGEPPEPPPERQRRLDLQPGDVLVFEEVLGPKTGVEADADPKHRHAVLLTRVEPGVDELYDVPVVEIEWAAEDALSFPLCLSSVGRDCEEIEDVSVAHGNAILVEHGQRVPDEEIGKVDADETPAGCDCAGRPGERGLVARPFVPPPLSRQPLTFSDGPGPFTSATGALRQDPRRASPRVVLHAAPSGFEWQPAPDLLRAGPADRLFVVEVDDEGEAHLRFGNGDAGRRPEPHESFTAHYRTGNGVRGNVGSEAIARLVVRGETVSGGITRVRNPLAAQGGVDPEPVADAKLLAPSSFRSVLERAVIADDYARLAAQDPRLQRAVASLDWTGSWFEARVALDPLGREEAAPDLVADVTRSLERYRRMGHDLAVVPAHYVPIDLRLLVCVRPGYLRDHVRAAVLGVLSTRRLPDGRLGLFHPDNETFGGGVAVSTIVAAVQAVAGVESVVVTRLTRLDEPPSGELESGLLPLGPSEIARLDNDPSFPGNGRLELDVRGGR